MSNKHIQHNQDGITLLITLLLMGVLLGVSTSLLNITLKQFKLSGIAYASEMAFQAAVAGMECAQFRDAVTLSFNQVVNGAIARTSIDCFGSGPILDMNTGDVISGSEQKFQFDLGVSPDQLCVQISAYKFYESPSFDSPDTTGPRLIIAGGIDARPSRACSEGGECTVIQSRGYNVSCGSLGTGTRVVERELTEVR